MVSLVSTSGNVRVKRVRLLNPHALNREKSQKFFKFQSKAPAHIAKATMSNYQDEDIRASLNWEADWHQDEELTGID